MPPTTTFNVLLILLPSVDLAVIIALPLALAVINPVLLTVATAALLDDQVSRITSYNVCYTKLLRVCEPTIQLQPLSLL